MNNQLEISITTDNLLCDIVQRMQSKIIYEHNLVIYSRGSCSSRQFYWDVNTPQQST